MSQWKQQKLEGAKPNSVLYFIVELLSLVRLFATPWTAARPASLSFTIS